MTTPKRMSKAQVVSELAERTGLAKQEVQKVFEQLLELIGEQLGPDGPGEFILPDLVKLRVKVTPGREEHVGIDPFTKEERTFAARPESRKVRATPLKPLKDAVD